MATDVRCPNCGNLCPLPADVCGSDLRCPACQHAFRADVGMAPAGDAPADAQVRAGLPAPTPCASGPSGPPKLPAAERPVRLRKQPAASSGPWLAAAGIIGVLAILLIVMVVGTLTVGWLLWHARAVVGAGDQAHRADAGGPVADVPDNLLVNGSFEDGPEPGAVPGYTGLGQGSTAIRGWEVSRGDIDYIGPFWQPADGKRSIDLNGLFRGGIRQTFNTKKGQSYRVTFSMAAVFHLPPPMKKLRVSAAGHSAEFGFDAAGSTEQNMGWVTHHWDFTAVADQTILEFESLTEGANGPALDRVSVVPLNAPKNMAPGG